MNIKLSTNNTHGLEGEGGKKLLPLILLLPALMFVGVIYLYPLALSIVRAFEDLTGNVSLVNFHNALSIYRKDLIFTIEVTVLGTLLATFFGVLLAVYIRLNVNSPVWRFINSVSRLGIFLPYVVVAQMMRSFLAPHGLLNVLLANVRLIDIEHPLMFFNIRGLLLSFLWKEVPFVIFITLSALQVLDDSYIEAARSIGARTHNLILRILVPMVKPSIMIASVLTFCTIVSTFTVPFMLLPESPTMLTVDIAHRVTYFRDYGIANALGALLYLIVGPVAVYYLRRVVREETYGY